MLNYLKNTPRKTIAAWSAIFLIYMLFIFLLSYLYPYGADEYVLKQDTVMEAIKQYFFSYTTENARIGLLINNIILSLGKWSFLILNPLVQVVWLLSFFGLVYLRKPDFKNLHDLPVMALIAVISVFAVAQPDNTLFWIGGACNYSWSILPFFWILTWLRLEYRNRGMLSLSKKAVFGLFITAIALGMSSENSAPLTMGLIICFIIGCKLARIKLKAHFYLITLGLIIGLVLLFAAPAMWNRLNTDIFAYFNESTLSQKLFWHIGHIHFYINAVFMTPVLVFLALLICGMDKDKPSAFRNENYVLSFIFFISAWILAAVLFAVPFITGRCFYTASVASALSVIFMLLYLQETYKFSLIKYAAIFVCAAAISYTPGFVYPYVHLYKQNKQRQADIVKAQNENKKSIFLLPYKYLKGPNENLTIMYYDPLYGFLGYPAHIDMQIQTDESKTIKPLYMFSNENVI